MVNEYEKWTIYRCPLTHRVWRALLMSNLDLEVDYHLFGVTIVAYGALEPGSRRMSAVPGRMLAFTTVARQTPAKRAAPARGGDFHEIYADFIDAKAAEQASRCSQCGVPFCQTHCPLHNNIPDWLRMSAEGRLEEAYALSQATNSMPEICGRICPQDRLCEGNCVIEQSGHGTITIGAVERYLSDKAWADGWVKPLVAGSPRGQSVGIVGSGPAGLAAAERLVELGYAV